MGTQNAVFYLPYLEKRCVIIFLLGAFPFRQTGGLGWDGWNTCPALSAAQLHICPPALLCGICFKKNLLWIKPHLSFKGFLDAGWQRVIHAHLIKINKMCQSWPPSPSQGWFSGSCAGPVGCFPSFPDTAVLFLLFHLFFGCFKGHHPTWKPWDYWVWRDCVSPHPIPLLPPSVTQNTALPAPRINHGVFALHGLRDPRKMKIK